MYPSCHVQIVCCFVGPRIKRTNVYLITYWSPTVNELIPCGHELLGLQCENIPEENEVLPELYCTHYPTFVPCHFKTFTLRTEAEFLDVIGTKEFSPLLFTATSANEFYSLPLEQKRFETGLSCKQCIRKPQVWELSRLCPENLNEIVRSWIRLQVVFVFLTSRYKSK